MKSFSCEAVRSRVNFYVAIALDALVKECFEIENFGEALTQGPFEEAIVVG